MSHHIMPYSHIYSHNDHKFTGLMGDILLYASYRSHTTKSQMVWYGDCITGFTVMVNNPIPHSSVAFHTNSPGTHTCTQPTTQSADIYCDQPLITSEMCPLLLC